MSPSNPGICYCRLIVAVGSASLVRRVILVVDLVVDDNPLLGSTSVDIDLIRSVVGLNFTVGDPAGTARMLVPCKKVEMVSVDLPTGGRGGDDELVARHGYGSCQRWG